jgi:hypothetical protein
VTVEERIVRADPVGDPLGYQRAHLRQLEQTITAVRR